MKPLIRVVDKVLRKAVQVALLLVLVVATPVYVAVTLVHWFELDATHVFLLSLAGYALYAFRREMRSDGTTLSLFVHTLKVATHDR